MARKPLTRNPLFGLLPWFWLGLGVGVVSGVIEGRAIVTAEPHVFQSFSGSMVALAVARGALLMGIFYALIATLTVVFCHLLGRVVAVFRSRFVVAGLPFALVVAGWHFLDSAWQGRASLLGGALSVMPPDRLKAAIAHQVVGSLGIGLAAGAVVAAAAALIFRKRDSAGAPTRRSVAVSAAAAVIAAVTAMPGSLERTAPSTAVDGSRFNNVVLVVVDTLRSDRLGCYGYHRPTSPNLDRLAKRSLVYERAIAQYPATGPSFGSILTSKYVRRHGLSSMDPRAWIGGDFNTTLAEILTQVGYSTAAITTGIFTEASGLGRGFEVMFREMRGHETHRVDSAWGSLRCRLAVRRTALRIRHILDRDMAMSEALRWLGRRHERPFFLLVHLFHPHAPYDPPDELEELIDPGYDGPHSSFYMPILRRVRSGERSLTESEVRRLNALYDAEVRATDASIGRLLDAVETRGLGDSTLLIVTADHGEELYDHQLVEHGYIYNSNLHVPLIVALPSRPAVPIRITRPVELIDIMPTILSELGIAVPKGIDGTQLDVDRQSDSDPDFAFSEADCEPRLRPNRDCWVSIQNTRWKLDKNLSRDTLRLFDLVADPSERYDVSSRHPEVAAELEARLDEWNRRQPDLADLRRRINDEGRVQLEDQLRALGYID